MSRLDRARQFAPFEGLKGLQEALKKKEIEHDKLKEEKRSDKEYDFPDENY